MKKSEGSEKRPRLLADYGSDSESRYRSLFEVARDGVLVLEFDTGQITDVGPFLIELHGHSLRARESEALARSPR